jgi:hypothetical protein
VRRFNDDDGPFDNVWWLVDSDLAIRRAGVLNPWILENGSPSPGAAETFYQHNLPPARPPCSTRYERTKVTVDLA